MPTIDNNGDGFIGWTNAVAAANTGKAGRIGTSFSAPITAGVAALLRQRAANQANLQTGHLLEKVAIMHSASKHLKDCAGVLWVNSPCATSAANPAADCIPLDAEMGTGQLNALAAVKQYTPTQGAAARNDLGLRSGSAQNVVQTFNLSNLKKWSLVASTLSWDRNVTHANGLNLTLVQLQTQASYNVGDLQDLELRLRNTDTNAVVAA